MGSQHLLFSPFSLRVLSAGFCEWGRTEQALFPPPCPGSPPATSTLYQLPSSFSSRLLRLCFLFVYNLRSAHFIPDRVALMVKNSPANAGDVRDTGSIPRLGGSSGRGHGNPLQCSCLENPHEQRSLAGYSSWGCKESDMTE